MARYKTHDYRQRIFLPVSLEEQLMSGTLEFAILTLVEKCINGPGDNVKVSNKLAWMVFNA
jgi:hypothetical protein